MRKGSTGVLAGQLGEPPHRVTLADLARLTGVSESTVSRALRSDPQISLHTQQRVQQIAEQVSYVPNSAARSLVLRRSHIFGLVVPDVTDPIHGQMIAVFEQEAAAVGYSSLIASIDGETARERAALRLLAAASVDGIAIWGSLQDPAEVVAMLRPSPVVFMASENPRLGSTQRDALVGSIRTDEAAGARALVEHLVESGRTRILYLSGPHAASNLFRQVAARQALARAGIRGRMPTVRAGRAGWKSPAELVERLRRKSPDAVICYDDKLALALIDALRRVDVKVPDDVAVVGFDDIPFAALSNPRLTTVSQPIDEMGRRAVGMLLAALRYGVMPTSEVLPVRMVVRESSARSSARGRSR